MSIQDTYLTLQSRTEGIYREKGSKFQAYAFPCSSEEAFQATLLEIKKIHPKARHHCYAYRLGLPGDKFRYNDDGEPSSSAGRPIYNAILSAELYRSAVVVVRYFGGTKLGIPGLIHAYRTAGEEAIKENQIVKEVIVGYIKLAFDYKIYGSVMGMLNQENINIHDTSLDLSPYIIGSVPLSEVASTIDACKAHLLGYDVSDIKEDTQHPDCHISEIDLKIDVENQ